GHDEYVEHGWNGLVVDWDDHIGTARTLDLLARDRRLLHFLRSNALETARMWPSTRQSAQFMAAALQSIAAAPAQGPQAAALRLPSDVRVGLETYRLQLQERDELAVVVAASSWAPTLVSVVAALRRRRWARMLARPLRPLIRRMRERLV